MAHILLIEDDSKLLKELDEFLSSRGHDVQGASSGAEGIELFNRFGCDILITDIRLPGITGLEIVKQLSLQFPVHPPFLIITGHGDKALVLNALREGVFDFLDKPFTPSQLLKTVDRALSEKKSDIAAFQSSRQLLEGADMTPREREVTLLVSEGLTNKEIAEKLSMAEETVKFHLKRIFKKLHVENRTQLSNCFKKEAA